MWLAETVLAVATTLGVLQGIPVGDEETAVPPDAALLMINAKHDLRDLAQVVLKSQSGNGPAIAASVRNTMVAALQANGIEVGAESTTEQYGNVVAIDVAAPEGHRDLLAVVVTLSIPCGADSALFLFRRDDGDWRLVYEREENDYESITGALGSFDWKVSPPDGQGRFLVVTSSITPWCVSAWHQLRYQVDRVEPGSRIAVPIDHGEFTSYGWDVELAATADSWSIHFDGSSFDPAILVRPYRLHYVLDGDQPVRVDPIAGSPRDFVEEWLGMDDETAARFSAIDPEELAEWRDDISSVRERSDGLNEFGPTGRCSERGADVSSARQLRSADTSGRDVRSPQTWQVRIDHYVDDKFEEYVPWYFTVSESNGSYRLSEIAYEPRGDCPASDTIAGSE